MLDSEPGFAFGTMRLTGEGLWGPPANRPAAIRLLQAAADSGVARFDTADAYGPGVSDELLAAALRPSQRDDIRVMVKVGLERPARDRWEPRGSPEALRAAVIRSLERLQVGAADALLLHTIDPDVRVEESVGTLADLAGAGLARQIGVCNVDGRALARAQDVSSIAIVQNPLNAIDTQHLRLAESCGAAGIEFTAWWPLRGGALARNSKLRELARPLGLTAAQLALAWFRVAAPDVLPVVGFTRRFEIEEALGSRADVDAELRAALEGVGA